MKTILLLMSLITCFSAGASEGKIIPLQKSDRAYDTYIAEVYDGNTGGSFAYRVTVNSKVSGCGSLQYSLTQIQFPPNSVEGVMKNKFMITASGFSPAVGCNVPPRMVTQSFDFPAEKGFLELVVSSGVEVTVEQLK